MGPASSFRLPGSARCATFAETCASSPSAPTPEGTTVLTFFMAAGNEAAATVPWSAFLYALQATHPSSKFSKFDFVESLIVEASTRYTDSTDFFR